MPGGRYKIGEDIPAGAYSITAINGGTNLTVWGAAYDDYSTNGGLLLNTVIRKSENQTLGKVVLESGNVIDFDCILSIEKYTGLDFVIGQENLVQGGRYTIGEDIPAGSYSITVPEGGTNLTVWGNAYDDYYTNGGLLLNTVINKQNPTLGKVILVEGNVIDFDVALIFAPFTGFSF